MSEASIAPLPAGMSPAISPERRRSGDEAGREKHERDDPGGESRHPSPPTTGAPARSLPEADESPVDAATLFAATLFGNELGAVDHPPPPRPSDEWEAPPSETRITDRKV